MAPNYFYHNIKNMWAVKEWIDYLDSKLQPNLEYESIEMVCNMMVPYFQQKNWDTNNNSKTEYSSYANTINQILGEPSEFTALSTPESIKTRMFNLLENWPHLSNDIIPPTSDLPFVPPYELYPISHDYIGHTLTLLTQCPSHQPPELLSQSLEWRPSQALVGTYHHHKGLDVTVKVTEHIS